MTQWYYSDAQRAQLGPVTADELAALHGRGQLPPDALVWREGMAGWRPWREMMGEVIAGSPAGLPASVAPAEQGTAVSRAETERSVYAPPLARLEAAPDRAPTGRIVHGGLWKRFAARMVDGVVVAMVLYALWLPLVFLGGGLDQPPGDPAAGAAATVLVLLIYPLSLLIPMVYYGWMQSSRRQATLGKLAVGIKVVRSDGRPVSFWRSALRELMYGLFGMVTCGTGPLIIGVMVAATERSQGLHDMASDTLVVDKFAFTDRPDLQDASLGTPAIVIFVLFGLLLVVATAAIVFAIAVGGR